MFTLSFLAMMNSLQKIGRGHFNQHARARSDVTGHDQLWKIRADRHLFFLGAEPFKVTSLQCSTSLQHSAVWGNCPSMRWSCKCCNFSSPNQRTLIVHYKLKHCHQIAKEFTRLTSMDINKFYEGLDSHLHKLLQLFRLKRFEEVQDMTSLMESLDKDASNQRKRAAALQGLPWYMKENPSTLMKRCEPTDPGEDFIKGMVIGILLVVEDVKEPLPVSYNDVAIVIEERLSCVILVMYPMLL
ncbi:hypothetical protein QQF64_015525 [Cirrhinus molitorella]|uniref:Uncharacterized protein n=1 Tax=Cirrhinus molitorella TaxID=172907 RepID=A0ABR3NVJ5_9TELE